MNLSDQEWIELRDNIRHFMRETVVPEIAHHEATQTFPWQRVRDLVPFGYVGGFLPESLGGMGIDHRIWSLMIEEIGYHWLSMRTMVNGINSVLKMLASHASEEIRARYLQPLLACRISPFFALTEPDTGSNSANLQTRADRDGDRYLISGRKQWITNGLWGNIGLVVAKTYSPTCNGKPSLFLVDRSQSHFETRSLPLMMLRCTGTAELLFSDTEVPATHLIGEEGGAMKIVMAGLEFGRLNVASGAVGAAQCALDLALDYARTRQQFGKPIGSFQLIQKHIVDMKVRVDAGRALVRQAADALDRGCGTMECSIAKLYATESAHEVANMALQVHGGQGYAADYPVERIFRDTRGGMIPEGTSEIQTLIIGRELLGISALR